MCDVMIASEPASHWRVHLEPLDCCCTVVRTLEEAVEDPHPTARALFEAQAEEPGGRRLVSTPLPLAPVFREKAERLRKVAPSGEDTMRLLDQPVEPPAKP
jgi:crotonobetainyl-CoA:carnitine CoA-transferase CaiB-like acyl-CoA transferase